MPAPVVVRLQVDGVDQIRRAFQSVEEIVTRGERNATSAVARGARSRLTEVEREAKAKKRELEKTAQDQIAIWKKVDNIHRQAQDQAVRETERAEQAKRRIVEREAREVVNIETAMLRKRQQAQEHFHRAVSGMITRGAHTGVRAATGMVGAALSLGGGFGIADSMHRSMELSSIATDIAIQGHVTGPGGSAANKRQRSGKEVEGAIRSTSLETGMEAGDVGKGLQKFTNLTGDLQLGLDLLPQLAKFAQATGTSFDDMAQSAGNISKALEGTKDPAKGTMDVLKSMAGQGRESSIELKDFAVQVAKITATGGKFEGTSVENAVKMASLMQDARGGGGAWNAASAATSVNSFGAAFGKGARRDAFKAKGINLNGADGKVRDPFEIIAESIDKTGGDIEGLNKLYGSVMADRVVRKHVGVYQEAEKKKKGSGKEAILKRMHDNAGVSLSDDEVNTGFKMKMDTDAVKIQKARASFDKVINDDLMPLLPQLVKEFSALIPYVGDAAKAAASFARFAAGNPLGGIGTIIAASIVKEMAAAAIGRGIESALTTSLGRSGGLAVASAVIAIEVGKLVIDSMVKSENRTIDQSGKDQLEATNLLTSIRGGTATPAEVKRAGQLSKDLLGDVDAVNQNQANPSTSKNLAYGAMGLVDPEQEIQARADDKVSSERTAKMLTDSHDQLIKALNALTAAQGGGAAAGGGGGDPAARSVPIPPSNHRS